ncbi:class I SAM-dependent methyltransferase [Streptomyces sp. NPDC056165]|uniref:class I SAM-dependent methyltransferase n=1 Tax=Streptomyces sp. NPDC056165 TaxID=3345733 RepID=UPI0035DCE6F0
MAVPPAVRHPYGAHEVGVIVVQTVVLVLDDHPLLRRPQTLRQKSGRQSDRAQRNHRRLQAVAAQLVSHSRAAGEPHAQAAEEGLDRITFEQGDAQIHPLPTFAFDVAISRFGVMFFDDPVAAFSNIGRALRLGGQLAFVCMADPTRSEWVPMFGTARAYLPLPAEEPATADGPGMFSLADPSVIHRILDAAGFDKVRTEPVETVSDFGRDAHDAADHLLGSGPGQHLVKLLDSASSVDSADRPSSTDSVRAAFTVALAAHEQPAGVHLRTSAWLVTATRR